MKSLGYFGCDYNHQLIIDIAETFEDNLQDLSETDQAWLLGKLGDYLYINCCNDVEPTPEAEELISRLYELPPGQIGSLLQAIVNKSSTKSLGYWGLHHELPLINDVGETFGWNLQELSEIDHYWLIARLGSYFWLHHCDGAPTEEAQELVNRIEFDELPYHQVSALISAIGNK